MLSLSSETRTGKEVGEKDRIARCLDQLKQTRHRKTMGREIARLKHASMLTGCRPCFGEKSQGTQTYVFAERQHFEGLEGNEIAGFSNSARRISEISTRFGRE